MKQRISKLYNTYANKLVEFSKLYGAKSWIIFLFIFSLIIVTTSSGWTLEPTQLPESRNMLSVQIDNCNREQEVRGVWLTNVDSDVLFSTENTTNAIVTLAELNFNTLYPTVWNWGYTLYPSAVAKQEIGIELDPTEGLQDRDVLQEIIDQGHQKGMAVIPWFEFGFMAPADSELAKRHPEWLTQRADGSTIWVEGKTHERVWLNPLHPEVQKFITDLIVEVVSNYDVEGIQLDDHFGYPSELGYDDYTVALYQQEHDGKLPPKNAQDPAWIRWRANKITDYVAELFQAIKQANPQAIISLSPNPQDFSLKSYLLDWQTWERKGLIEELVVQIYRNSTNSFLNEVTQPEIIAAKEHIPVSIGILSGLKGRNVLFSRIRQQVDITRNRNFAGVSFFFYESLWNMALESPEQRKTDLKSLFKTPTNRVDLACKH
ncbi:MAG: glycoside hydrolase family 10 protein [Xenococcus sp. (in: cyanobacteria)]